MGATVRELQRKITSTEFNDWKVFLQEEVNERNILYHYLARLTYEVVRQKAKFPKRLKIEDFHIKVGRPQDKPKKAKIKSTPKSSKQMWLAGFQIKNNPFKKKKD